MDAEDILKIVLWFIQYGLSIEIISEEIRSFILKRLSPLTSSILQKKTEAVRECLAQAHNEISSEHNHADLQNAFLLIVVLAQEELFEEIMALANHIDCTIIQKALSISAFHGNITIFTRLFKAVEERLLQQPKTLRGIIKATRRFMDNWYQAYLGRALPIQNNFL